MAITVQCECGATTEFPHDLAGTCALCPQCMWRNVEVPIPSPTEPKQTAQGQQPRDGGIEPASEHRTTSAMSLEEAARYQAVTCWFARLFGVLATILAVLLFLIFLANGLLVIILGGFLATYAAGYAFGAAFFLLIADSRFYNTHYGIEWREWVGGGSAMTCRVTSLFVLLAAILPTTLVLLRFFLG